MKRNAVIAKIKNDKGLMNKKRIDNQMLDWMWAITEKDIYLFKLTDMEREFSGYDAKIGFVTYKVGCGFVDMNSVSEDDFNEVKEAFFKTLWDIKGYKTLSEYLDYKLI